MSGERSARFPHGLWLVLLAAAGLLAVVAWDQLHLKRSAAPPAAPAQMAAEPPAVSGTPSVPDAAAPPPTPGDSSGGGSAGETRAEEPTGGQHAM